VEVFLAVGGHDATWPQHADSEQLLAALLELAVRFKLTKGNVEKAVEADVPI
jgi:hypothetical protein